MLANAFLRTFFYALHAFSVSLQIAFHDLNPFPMRTINHKREHHFKLLEVSLSLLFTPMLHYGCIWSPHKTLEEGGKGISPDDLISVVCPHVGVKRECAKCVGTDEKKC